MKYRRGDVLPALHCQSSILRAVAGGWVPLTALVRGVHTVQEHRPLKLASVHGLEPDTDTDDDSCFGFALELLPPLTGLDFNRCFGFALGLLPPLTGLVFNRCFGVALGLLPPLTGLDFNRRFGFALGLLPPSTGHDVYNRFWVLRWGCCPLDWAWHWTGVFSLTGGVDGHCGLFSYLRELACMH